MALPQGPYCHSTRLSSTTGSCPASADPRYLPRPSSSSSSPTSFFYLPPAGLGLQLKGSNPNSLFDCRDDFESGPTSSQSPSRKFSSSSSRSTASTSTNLSESTAPSSSASFLEEKMVGRRKHEVREALGEDPALAAARHALWEDPPVNLNLPKAPSAPAGSTMNGQEPVEEDDDEDDEDEDDVPPVDLPPLASPSRPSHATLPPLASCLRPPSRPPSPTSSHSSSRHSVQFSPDPPESAATYSPVDYERGGEQQVEKLSMREFIELRDVRTAIGLWSGKIKSGEESVEVKEEVEVTETTGITMHLQRPGVRTLSQGRSAWPL